MVFVPSPGAQTEAYLSEADILLYGGEPGGGKTGLILGLALNEHERSLIVRRQFADLGGVIDNAIGLVGNDKGFVQGGRPKYNKPDGGVIHFEGLGKQKGTGIDTGKQGNPHDLIGVDEAAQLTQAEVLMLYGWLRSTKPGQRTRMILGSNPPLNAIGDWLIDFFGPWLNPKHPNPAKPGELRWFYMDANNKSVEVDGSDFRTTINGITIYPHSRTFIPAGLKDNPFLSEEEYSRRLSAIPEPFRTRLVSGNFMLARTDPIEQMIPTEWVRLAQERWTTDLPQGVPMSSMGVDVAQGGADNTVLSARYGHYFASFDEFPGIETPHGNDVAGRVLARRRDMAHVVIDVGGGWGADAYGHLTRNGVEATAYMGVKATAEKTTSGHAGFNNERTKSLWRLREALDPAQPGGSFIALPPDAELLADLTTVTMVMKKGESGQVIHALSKQEVRDLLGRSPDKGDAVIMAWSKGPKISNMRDGVWTGNRTQEPKVVMGFANRRRTRVG